MADIDNLIGERLRKHRQIMGYSQTEVAKRLGLVSSAIVSRWENGQCRPNIEYALHLSRLYRTLVNELFWDLDRQAEKKLYAKNNDP